MRAVHPQRFDHHCTLTFRPSAEVRAATPVGARVVMQVVGMVITDEVQVAIIEFRDDQWPPPMWPADSRM